MWFWMTQTINSQLHLYLAKLFCWISALESDRASSSEWSEQFSTCPFMRSTEPLPVLYSSCSSSCRRPEYSGPVAINHWKCRVSSGRSAPVSNSRWRRRRLARDQRECGEVEAAGSMWIVSELGDDDEDDHSATLDGEHPRDQRSRTCCR